MPSDKSLRETRLVFYKDDVDSIDAILDVFLKQSAAKCALLVDKDGHMVTCRGESRKIDLDTISALVAGSFAATREMARVLGEDEFSALFHQGKSDNIQRLSLVSDRALLTAIFDETTTIGMVRLYAAEAAKQLGTIFSRKEALAATTVAGPVEENKEFRSGSAGALDQHFGS